MHGTYQNDAARNGRQSADRHGLAASKTIQAFDFLLRSFGLARPWDNADGRENHAHDLGVMLRQGDLEWASLELLAADQTVLYRHRVVFQTSRAARSVDAAGGIELPVMSREQIADSRIVMGPTRRIDTYRDQLRCNWGRAARLADKAGGQFTSDHTRSTNGGWVDGEVFVADQARHQATIINVSRRGDYAFARDAALGADVFLHRHQCDEPFTFQSGQRASFVVIQSPRGLQGRNIREESRDES
jgi:cold shock CspA family protein